MGFDLMPHNQRAYDNVKTIFRTQNRAAVIHPTGTGKGRISRKLIEDNQEKKILYISPSLAINNSLEKSLKKHGVKTENLEIFTYQKLTRMTKGEIEELKFDYIILDEFHHCGAKEWGMLVNRLLNVNGEAKILGLSATPLRYTASGIRDMTEELFGNVIASEMSLEAAVAGGILNEPTYVTSIYAYEKIIDDLEKQVDEFEEKGNKKRIKRKEIAKQELDRLKKYVHEAITSLPEVLEKSIPNKNGKYIVFCSSIEDMKAKIEAAPELFKNVNANIEIRQVSSDENDVAKNERTLRNFEEDKNPETLKLLFCVNMLNEGYHLKDLDGGIMMRSTASPTLYTQQFGRIVSAGKKGDTVLIDLVNNIDAIENIVRFYENLSRERKNKETGSKVRKFTMTQELRNIGEVVRKIESLVSRRANNIEVNFMKRLGISFDDAKLIIENAKNDLIKGRENNYDGMYASEEKESLELFYEMRKLKLKMTSEIEVGTESYNKKLKEYKSKRDEVIIKNIGIVKWMLKNIPELQNLNYDSEEDKLQTALKYLIEAADTYNPQLRTRDNKSLRFDEYLLVFIQSGMTQEKRDIEYEKYTEDILSAKAELEETYGKGKVTDLHIAQEMLTRTVEAIDKNQNEFFKSHPFYELLRKEIIDYREGIAKEEIYWEKRKGKDEIRTSAKDIRKRIARDVDDRDPYLLKMTLFQIKNACRKMEVLESYDAIVDFDINDYFLDDSEIIQPVGDSYISEGVYIEKQEPYIQETSAEEEFLKILEKSDNNFLKVDLEAVLNTLNEKERTVIKLRYDLGLKKEEVENGDKLIKNYESLHKAERRLRHPSRSKLLVSYLSPDRPLLGVRGRVRKKPTTVNYENNNSFDAASGDLESVKLSEIIESDELFNHLNEAGLWCLNDLVSMTEEQLKSELDCTDKMVIEIKSLLGAYGVELSDEEQEDVIAADLTGRNQSSKAETLKALMQKKKSQEEEIEQLVGTKNKRQNSGERED